MPMWSPRERLGLRKFKQSRWRFVVNVLQWLHVPAGKPCRLAYRLLFARRYSIPPSLFTVRCRYLGSIMTSSANPLCCFVNWRSSHSVRCCTWESHLVEAPCPSELDTSKEAKLTYLSCLKGSTCQCHPFIRQCSYHRCRCSLVLPSIFRSLSLSFWSFRKLSAWPEGPLLTPSTAPSYAQGHILVSRSHPFPTPEAQSSYVFGSVLEVFLIRSVQMASILRRPPVSVPHSLQFPFVQPCPIGPESNTSASPSTLFLCILKVKHGVSRGQPRVKCLWGLV